MANVDRTYLSRASGYQRPLAAAGLAMLAAAGLAIAAAPSLMPESYSWVRQVVSDTASQGTEGAWLTRSAFVLSGVSVMLLAFISAPSWGTGARAAHALYGALVLGLASFSRRAWTGRSFDAFEDLVHSGLAIVAGMVFTVAVLLVAVTRRRSTPMTRLQDWTTITVMALLPLVMLVVLDVAGLAQRVMVVAGFLWYGIEATRLMRASAPTTGDVRGSK